MARVTVEDCLEKIPSRFGLVLIAAKRCRELKDGAEPKVRHLKNKEAVTALREIAAGKIGYEPELPDLIGNTKGR
jgi:DNA-directed RNA polymerase subunit omega